MAKVIYLILGIILGMILDGTLFGIPHAINARMRFNGKYYIVTGVEKHTSFLTLRAIEIDKYRKEYK